MTLTYIARTNFRSDCRLFGIKEADRFQHLYLIGKTGVGKTTLLSFMALQDAKKGAGLCVIDPHGDMVSALHQGLADLPHRYLDLSDPKCQLGYNPLKHVPPERRSLAVSGFIEVLKSAWFDAWGPRMEHILRNSLYALTETAGATLADLLRLYSDKGYREKIGKDLSNETVRNFWMREYDTYSPGYRQDGTAAIQNKVGAFLSDPLLRKALISPREDISLRGIMDRGEVLLVNLAKGRVGSDTANLLGGLLVTSLGLAAFSRADTPEDKRRPFFLYVDEFQNFTTLSLVSMLSELRKYKVGLIFAHQYVHQLSDEIRHAIFGNVGSVLSFRVGAEDAPIISRELFEEVSPNDLLHLPNAEFYLKLLIGGEPSKIFSCITVKGDNIEACN